jgi:phosphatidylserine/phosphatidylglycerophosphate/cardiolipin synthase-like enzyme
MATDNSIDIHFGGPDLPVGRLRDLLSERIGEVPSGGSIDWVTYYFRDRRLAQELIRAQRRGVKVSVTLEGCPRTPDANDAVKSILSGSDGLGKDFRTLSFMGIPTFNGKTYKPHLHAKLYCFSHPKPTVYIGSFNPSGDDPEGEPDIIREIGDQDRGHNVLVGIHDPTLVQHLKANAKWIFKARHPIFYRFSIFANCKYTGDDTEIFFWPRMLGHPVMKFLNKIAHGSHIRVAASHIKGNAIVNKMIGLSRRGAKLEILAGATERRVPAAIERKFKDAGIAFRRVGKKNGLPMHNKFVIAENSDQRWTIFGSFNWTTRSYWLNHEIGAISTNRRLWETFAQRWKELESEEG